MKLIDQRTKKIMEECKERARDAGLKFDNESLEYILTNRELLELSPKIMIPTLYDYWVHDIGVIQERGKYELYPSNPYETVINTRPAISFYNDNNPDWLNVMIFYHVLAHIDFFQNNQFFRHTWDEDFTQKALSDKREIAKIRSERGRWADYVIEFTRSVDNLVDYPGILNRQQDSRTREELRRDFYFDIFLQSVEESKVSTTDFIKEVDRFNECEKKGADFFKKINFDHPEFEALFEKYLEEQQKPTSHDLIEFLLNESRFLNRPGNKWMKPIIQIVHDTSLIFQPQIRTKIMNEGWASYWHEKLFLEDDRISGHEVDFSRVNSGVVSLPRVGMNPYALGMRMFQFIEEEADKGKYSFEFLSTLDAEQRKKFDKKTGSGKDFIFHLREYFNDSLFINHFINQDLVDKYKLFVVERRLNEYKRVWEYYVKSKKADDYRQMLLDSLYHPPKILFKRRGSFLHLIHVFEGKPLYKPWVEATMMGIQWLWGHAVTLETYEVESYLPPENPGEEPLITWRRVQYKMEPGATQRRFTRVILKNNM